ncbi:MAG: hypothetical protein AAF571_11505, partial [Verrucomicrobiota bacterium]
NIHCVIHDEIEDWYLVEEISDFHFDGYALISKDTVSKCRYDKNDKTFEDIIRKSGISPTPPPDMIQTSGNDFFTAIATLDTYISIESCDEDRFMIGTIYKVGTTRLLMNHFRADGTWFKRPTGIDYSEIGRACFLDEYGSSWYAYKNS